MSDQNVLIIQFRLIQMMIYIVNLQPHQQTILLRIVQYWIQSGTMGQEDRGLVDVVVIIVQQEVEAIPGQNRADKGQ